MSLIPITALTPSTTPPKDASIRGIVTLFWPYSSSTRQCALLLADPDFRLRNKQGQVRIRFTGASAEAVAKSRVGIGDEVVLSLHGASWEKDPEATRTPGRSVDGELFYRRRLLLNVKKDGGDVRIDVDAPASPPRIVEQDGVEVVATPLPKVVGKLRGSLDGTAEVHPGYAYTSPAFVKRLRLSGQSFLDSAFDPFAGDDMDVDDDNADQKRSFGRGMKWRYAAKTPSPTKETSTTFERVEQESPTRPPQATIHERDEAIEKMPPPPRPRLQIRSALPPPETASTMDLDEQDGSVTPKLHPVESPTLPLPSPFPTEMFGQSHFDLLAAGKGTQDQAQGSSEAVTRPQHDEAMAEAARIEDLSQPTQPEIPPAIPEQTFLQPETPPAVPLTSGFGFGFDGAIVPPPTKQEVSPQEVEKKRVMAQTFKSLFGFTGSSQPAEKTPEEQAEATETLSELEKQILDEVTPMTEPTLSGVREQLPRAADINDQASSEAVVSLPETQSKQPHTIPPTRTEPEVIEVDSSSEEEESDVDEEPPKQQPVPTAPDPKPRPKSPEIQDTYYDSQADTLMASQPRDSQVPPSMPFQDTLSPLQRQRTDDSLLESFIEPEHLYPTLPPAEISAQEIDEYEMTGKQSELQTSQVAESQQAAITEPSLQQPSYPSLPLSPSNSQSIQDMASQAILEVPETMIGLLPPTPQLTQVGSSATQMLDMLPPQEEVSQQQQLPEVAMEEEERIEEHFVESPELQGHKVAATQESEAPAQEMFAEEPKVQETEVPDPAVQEPALQEATAPKPSHEEQPVVPAQEQAGTGRITRARAKKAAAGRVGNIPDAIASYFSPKRSSGVTAAQKATKSAPTEEATTNGHVEPKAEDIKLANGFSTSLAYFTPLSRLDLLLNPSSSQQLYGSTNTVDVLAVVTDSTTEPVRAKAGPKDHYTIFLVTDNSLTATTSVRVEVFRPYKNTLPVAKEGDVILLRAFAVKSRKRQPYLISSDASAWCVFSYPEQPKKGKPKWAMKAGEESEKITGPPVEFGQEERDHALGLKKWWEAVRPAKDGGNDDDGNEVNGVNGHVAEPVAAKL